LTGLPFPPFWLHLTIKEAAKGAPDRRDNREDDGASFSGKPKDTTAAVGGFGRTGDDLSLVAGDEKVDIEAIV
jgi:hypothetical protein